MNAIRQQRFVPTAEIEGPNILDRLSAIARMSVPSRRHSLVTAVARRRRFLNPIGTSTACGTFRSHAVAGAKDPSVAASPGATDTGQVLVVPGALRSRR